MSNNKKNLGLASILDKDTKNLPNIIWSFRNGRTSSVGYDDPAYFGFALDIHSQSSESASIYNPYNGLRANPLFYIPDWANVNKDGSGIMEANTDGKKFPNLLADASEACAIQYLNSFSFDLSETPDEYLPKGVILNEAARNVQDRPAGDLNRGFYLAEFIKILNYIQEFTPWSFKEVDGINNLWKATQAGYKFEPVTITITGDETVDLRLTRLAETYRMLSYDSFNNRKMLPPNLEKFSMDLYFIDLRFLKNGTGTGGQTLGINLTGGVGELNDETFSSQVNFGGMAFRCMGCRFDFSEFLEQSAAQVKSSISDSNFSPKFKIIIDRVMPASYFGDQAFGVKSLSEEYDMNIPGGLGNAIEGALNLGPFTGGIQRVLSAGRRALSNILGAPQRALNDALRNLETQFDQGVDNFLGTTGLDPRPFEKQSVEELINARSKNGKISNDMFPGTEPRTAAPIKNDVFPGTDPVSKRPIKSDIFPGKDDRTTLPIKRDEFPGDVPITYVLNQRKVGGKITSQNPFKP